MIKVEERRKELDEVFNSAKLKHTKLESILEERYEENKKLVQKLKEKETEIQRLSDEVQTLDAYKEQVGFELLHIIDSKNQNDNERSKGRIIS